MIGYEITYTNKLPIYAKNNKDAIERAKQLANLHECIKEIKRVDTQEIIYKEE